MASFKMDGLRKILWLLILTPVSMNPLQAQAPDIPVFKQVTHPFMPAITSQYFFFSQDGQMWFSTSQGLTSFDGSDIVYHSPLQLTTQFELSRIWAMVEDKDHNFYIGTSTSLLYFDRKAQKITNITYTYKDDHTTRDFGIVSMYLDENGLLYAGAGLMGLFIYDPAGQRLEHYNLDASKPDSWRDRTFNTVCSFTSHATDRNKLWVGTYHGIYLFDKKEKKFSQHFMIVSETTHKYNPTLSTDKQRLDLQRMETQGDSLIWFSSWAGGFWKYEVKTGKAYMVFGRDAIYKAKDLYYGYVIAGFLRLSTDKFLIGIHSGKTAVYDTRINKATYFNISGYGYLQEQTRYLSFDGKGNIWMLQKGLLYIAVPENRRFKSITIPNHSRFSLVAPKLRGMFYDSSSQLYYGCFHGSTGVHVFDRDFVQQKIIPTALINNFYNYGTSIDVRLAKDGSGRYWVLGWKMHVLLQGETKFEPVEKRFPSLAWLGKEDRFNDLTVTRAGNILFRESGGLVYHLNHQTLLLDTIRIPEMKKEGLQIKDASAWYDRNRNLLYLTKGGGIVQYALGNKKSRMLGKAALFGNLPHSETVCTPALDAAGRIWLMIPKYGIRIIDPGSLRCVDSILFGTRGLFRADFTAMVGGSEHYMLFRSQNGVVVYDAKKQQSFLLDRSNGLSSPEIVSFFYCNGYMFIGQQDRFEYFRLSDLDNYVSTINPYLSSVKADTAQVFKRTGLEKDSIIRLPYFQNTLSFSFSAAEFLFPERIEYAYKLTPLEDEWHYTNYFNRKIIYSKLPPGKYIFHLRSQVQGGDWSAKSREYTITIAAAWWQTIFFRIICALAGVGLLIYGLRRRVNFVRKKEKERSSHEKELLELESKALRAQMNPHFIFNSLNSIKSLINKNENTTAAIYLTTFSKLIRTLFQHSDKREVSLYEELETCRLYTELEKMRFGDKVDFVFEVDQDLDLKDIKVPALVIQPFIENSIWHGLVPKETGGRVCISVKNKGTTVECVVDDDGIGRGLSENYKAQFESTHQSKGIGLTQSRLELDKLLNDREDAIEIIDKKGPDGSPAGTTVILTFSIR